MVKTKEKDYYFQIEYFGDTIEIQKDGSQIRIERDDESEYIDVNISIIRELRNVLTKVIEDNETP